MNRLIKLLLIAAMAAFLTGTYALADNCNVEAEKVAKEMACPDCKSGEPCAKCADMMAKKCEACAEAGKMCEHCAAAKKAACSMKAKACPACKEGKPCDKCKARMAEKCEKKAQACSMKAKACPACKEGKPCDKCKARMAEKCEKKAQACSMKAKACPACKEGKPCDKCEARMKEHSMACPDCKDGKPCDQCKAKMEMKKKDMKSTMTEQQQGEDYAWTTCPVSGRELGTMGKPYVHHEGDREVQFCCKGCLPKFAKNPAAYLSKMDADLTKLQ